MYPGRTGLFTEHPVRLAWPHEDAERRSSPKKKMLTAAHAAWFSMALSNGL